MGDGISEEKMPAVLLHGNRALRCLFTGGEEA